MSFGYPLRDVGSTSNLLSQKRRSMGTKVVWPVTWPLKSIGVHGLHFISSEPAVVLTRYLTGLLE